MAANDRTQPAVCFTITSGDRTLLAQHLSMLDIIIPSAYTEKKNMCFQYVYTCSKAEHKYLKLFRG